MTLQLAMYEFVMTVTKYSLPPITPDRLTYDFLPPRQSKPASFSFDSHSSTLLLHHYITPHLYSTPTSHHGQTR